MDHTAAVPDTVYYGHPLRNGLVSSACLRRSLLIESITAVYVSNTELPKLCMCLDAQGQAELRRNREKLSESEIQAFVW